MALGALVAAIVVGAAVGAALVVWGDSEQGWDPVVAVKSSHDGFSTRWAVCALRESGKLVCWSRGGAEVLPGRHRDMALDPYGLYVCAVEVTGELKCYADAKWGQWPKVETEFVEVSTSLGYRCVPPECDDGGQDEAPPGKYVAVALGSGHACAIRRGGEIVCWGDVRDADRGLLDAPRGRFAAISAGLRETCAIRVSGDLVCWGKDGEIETPPGRYQTVDATGYPNCALRESGEVACWGGDPANQTEAPQGKFSAIATGIDYACAIRESGELACWGEIEDWEQPFVGSRKFVALDLGAEDCGVLESGALFCWTGHSPGGEPPPGHYRSVSASSFWGSHTNYTCAVRDSGEIECWGWEAVRRHIPPGEFQSVSAARFHPNFFSIASYTEEGYRWLQLASSTVCALRVTGEPVCWNPEGVLPDAAPAGKYVALATGSGGFACGVQDTGAIACWETVPQPPRYDPGPWFLDVPAGSYVAVSAGGADACGLRNSGDVVCWQLEGGVDVHPGPYRTLGVAWNMGCGVKRSGELACWGLGSTGVSDETLDYYASVVPPSAYDLLEVGGYVEGAALCTLRESGELACWSDEWSGSSAPPGSYQAVSLADSHACALRQSGEVVCWRVGRAQARLDLEFIGVPAR